MADIVLINPAFDTSYWGLEHALPLFGKLANVPPASLPLLAALTPSEHHVTLVDESVEELDFDQLARADIVGITGMSVQRRRMRRDPRAGQRARWIHGRGRPMGDRSGRLF